MWRWAGATINAETTVTIQGDRGFESSSAQRIVKIYGASGCSISGSQRISVQTSRRRLSAADRMHLMRFGAMATQIEKAFEVPEVQGSVK